MTQPSGPDTAAALAAFDDYCTAAGLGPSAHKNYRAVVKRFLRWIDPQGVGLAQVSPPVVEQFLASLAVIPTTGSNYRSTLRRFFDALVVHGLLPANVDAGAGLSPGGAAAQADDPPLTVEKLAAQLAELYSALEAVLPFAETDVDCLAIDVEDFPDDPEYAEDDAEELRRGREAIAAARRLIAQKPSYLAGDGKDGDHRP
jgi:hypothetical protein